MNKEKKYLVKTIELITNVKASNLSGVMYRDVTSGQILYFSARDMRNASLELEQLKEKVCLFCQAHYQQRASKTKGEEREICAIAADTFYRMHNSSISAESLYGKALTIKSSFSQNKKVEQEEATQSL